MGDERRAAGVRRNERVVHLATLRVAVQARRELDGRVVERRGVSWASVGRVGGTRFVEVGCDFVWAAWWFTWGDGRPIAPVENVEGVVDVLVRGLVAGP